eukprot:9003483-Pyramimonas_sp.AAC.1
MQGPWSAISKIFEHNAAIKTGQGWTEEAWMQGYPWEGCPSSLCGLTVGSSTEGPNGRVRMRRPPTHF